MRRLFSFLVLLTGFATIAVAGSRAVPQPSGSSPAVSRVRSIPRAALPSVRPPDVQRFTSSRESRRFRLDWITPADPSVQGVLVIVGIRPVTGRPLDGRSYSPSFDRPQVWQNAAAFCVAAPADNGCTVELPAAFPDIDALEIFFRAFTYDTRKVYSAGAPAKSLPIATSGAEWTYWTTSTSMQPAGVLPGEFVLATGNDVLFHRVGSAGASRAGWTPLPLAAPIVSRIMSGDLDPLGAHDRTAFATTADGRLHRVSLDDGTSAPEASAHVTADAGCAGGTLSAGPVFTLDVLDTNPVDGDDVVVAATRCGASDNRILGYGPLLGAPTALYDGGPDGLGIAKDNPRILYRDDAPNLVYVGVSDDGGESVVVLQAGAGATLSFYADVSGIGDVETIPIAFRRTASSSLLAVGTAQGGLHLFDAINRTGNTLVALDSLSVADGPVRGVSVSTRIAVSGGYENWVVWSTETAVHGVKVDAAGRFVPATRWDRALAGPSGPVVLRSAFAAGDVTAFVGTADGSLVALDATTGAISRSWLVVAGARLAEPTFDFGDGVRQGFAVATDAGGIFWIPLRDGTLAAAAPKPAAITEELDQQFELEVRAGARRATAGITVGEGEGP